MLYAALVQSVQVTFEGRLGMLPPPTIPVTSLSMLLAVSEPVYGSRLLSVSVMQRVLLLFVLRMTMRLGSPLPARRTRRAALPKLLTLRDTRPLGRSGKSSARAT